MYIRTSTNKILNVIKKKVSNFIGGFWYVCKNHNPKEIHSDFVIKEADSIDELCDCFVIEWLPTNHKDIFTIDRYSKEVVKSCIGNNKTKVYGAIWTEWGLKYVAKMDSEGKLVLI